MRKQTIKRNMFTILSIFVLVWALILWTGQASAQEIGPEGSYAFDLVNSIEFQNGQFNEQYLTDEYKPDIHPDQGAPGLEEETICSARGTYSITPSGIILEYEIDLCKIKQGTIIASYDPEADTVTIGDKIYKKEIPEDSRSYRARESEMEIAQIITNNDLNAGVKTWQWNVAEAMRNLNDNPYGIWYCSSDYSLHLNSDFWTWTSNLGSDGWIPNNWVEPSDAVNWYFGDVSEDEGCTECLMAARAVFYKGLLDTIGTTSFNSWFRNHKEDLFISNGPSPTSPIRVNKVISSESDLLRGDWVYFQNWVSTAFCPDIDPMQGENAITQTSRGTRTYIGLGIPGMGMEPVDSQYILNSLDLSWRETGCEKERELKLLTDNVQTASPSYFENFATLLVPLQNDQPKFNLSGSEDSMKHYKFEVPSGVNSFEINTTGGSGDCDLYVMKGQWASRSVWQYRSWSFSNEESVEINGNVSGVWYIMLHGYKSFSGVVLTASYDNDNNPPILSYIGNKIAYIDQQLKFRISATDLDGDILSYSISGKPSGASFNSSTRYFTWTPTASDRGTSASPRSYTITFIVNDGHGGTDSETITITVKYPKPERPYNPSPSHDSTSISRSTSLNWADSGYATSYDVYFGTSSSSLSYKGNVTSSYFSNSRLGTLEYDKTYYWQIKAKNPDDSNPGSIWRFTTGDGIPSIPIGASLTGNIESGGSEDWYKFTTLTSGEFLYTIETTLGTLSDTYIYLYGPDSQTLEVEHNDDGGVGYASKIERTLQPGKTYYVKVRAYSSSQTGTYTIKVAASGGGGGIWHGNGSIISYSSGSLGGFGLTYDMSVIHPSSQKPVVFFQWEIDSTDGKKLQIYTDSSSASINKATITYGPWHTRSQDKTYSNVSLPFTIDPAQDGFGTANGAWFVVQVAFTNTVSSSVNVRAKATTTTSSFGNHNATPDTTASAILIDGYKWCGNGSIISYSSGSLGGFGLTYDMSVIHPSSQKPVVFFQWEIDSSDGKKLQVYTDSSSSSVNKATITYGPWHTRSQDKTYSNVSLPFTIDPTLDGFGTANGAWFVVQVKFANTVSSSVNVRAKATN